jgi:hypothetical protein
MSYTKARCGTVLVKPVAKVGSAEPEPALALKKIEPLLGVDRLTSVLRVGISEHSYNHAAIRELIKSRVKCNKELWYRRRKILEAVQPIRNTTWLTWSC